MIQPNDQQTISPTTISSTQPTHDKPVIVTVKNVTKIFRDFWGRPKAKAVDNVSFDVYQGEIFGILGPNGSGKTTLLKMILGLLHPTRGVIKVFGKHPRDVQTKSRIGYLPEESYLYRYLDARETLDFFGRLFSIPQPERSRRIEQLLEMVGLAKVRARAVGEFSKGMQRRVGLAQALINDPDLVILDEPTSGLDPIGCREMKDLILLLAKRGKTIILSSHLLADVEDLCDRIMILYGGKIQALGTLDELLTKKDTIRITIPAPSQNVFEQLIQIIRGYVPTDKLQIDKPRQNLESFFMEVVRKAVYSATETSGATLGQKIADYLAGQAQPTAAEALLSKLAAPETPPPPTQPTPEATQTEPKLTKLQSLTQPEQSTTQSPQQPQKPEPDLSAADEKLRSLLESSENKSKQE